MLSRDFRQGYGPEEYLCRRAVRVIDVLLF